MPDNEASLGIGVEVDVSQVPKISGAADAVKSAVTSTTPALDAQQQAFQRLSAATQDYAIKQRVVAETIRSIVSGDLPQSTVATNALTDAQRQAAAASSTLKEAQQALKPQLDSTTLSVTEQRFALMGLEQASGIHIPRAFNMAIARSGVLKDALMTAFSTFAVLGFIDLLVQVTDKVSKLAGEYLILGHDMKEVMDEELLQQKEQIKLLDQIRQKELDNALIGKSGAEQQRILTQSQAFSVSAQAAVVADLTQRYEQQAAKVQLLEANVGKVTQTTIVHGNVVRSTSSSTQDSLNKERAGLEAINNELQTQSLRLRELKDDAAKTNLTYQFQSAKDAASELAQKERDIEQQIKDGDKRRQEFAKERKKEADEAAKLDKEALTAMQKYNEELGKAMVLEQKRQAEQGNKTVEFFLKQELDGITVREKAETDLDKFKQKIGMVSASREIQLTRTTITEDYALRYNALQNAIAMINTQDPNGPVLRAKLNAQVVLLDKQRDLQLAQNTLQSLEQIKQKWNTVFSTISSAFDSSIKGMIQGTQTFRQAMANIGNAILGQFISMLVQMVTQWVSNHLFMAIFGKSVQSATAAAQITSEAAIGAAAAYASTAAIPIIGPELAPAVAAATNTAILAFEPEGQLEQGTDYVPRTGAAMLHQGEAVMPAPFAQGLRDLIANGRPSGGDQNREIASLSTGLRSTARALGEVVERLNTTARVQADLLQQLRLTGRFA